MGGGARTLVRQPKTAVFFRKSPKPGGSKSVKFSYTRTCTPFGVSRVVCDAYMRLPARWPLGYFRSECRTGGETAPCMNCFLTHSHQCLTRGGTGYKYRFSSLQYDRTGNRNQSASVGAGACSTNCTT